MLAHLKKEYKNTHKQQLIDPSKLFKMLNKLKESGNKYYQFIEEFSEYEMRCMETDPQGYKVVFNTCDDVEEMSEPMGSRQMEDELLEQEEDFIERREELDYEQNDPVKKYQFNYNRSLCMTDKYPEVSVNELIQSVLLQEKGKYQRTY